MGPSLVMPVKRGDKVNLSSKYFYEEDAPGTTYDNLGYFVNEILIALATSGAGVLQMTETQLLDIAGGDPQYVQAVTDLLNNSFDDRDIHKPNAYLVWMLYDRNMRLMPQSSGAKQVQNPNALETLIQDVINIDHDGYLHAYVSNGSSKGVNFDNFLVSHQRGKVRQINDYYPYGLSISGINGDYDEYLNKYTAKELQTGEFNATISTNSTGIEMFDFGSRYYDPQLGRWFTHDPAEQFKNPYLGIGNNPVIYKDPNGEWVHIAIGAAIGGTANWMIQGGEWNAEGLGHFAVGAAAGAATAAVGAAAAPTFGTGFIGGAATGGITGAVSGSILGAGNTWVDGGSFGEGINQSFVGGAYGGISGAVLGGLAGGFQSIFKGNNFFTGEPGYRKKLKFLLEASREDLEKHFSKELLKSTKVGICSECDYLEGNFGETFTRPYLSGESYEGVYGYKSKIRISKNLVDDFYTKYNVDGPATVLHEFFHADQYYSGYELYIQYKFPGQDYITEIQAYQFEVSIFNNINGRIGLEQYTREMMLRLYGPFLYYP